MPFWCLGGLQIVLDHAALIEHRKSCEVSYVDCLDPCGFDWIDTHCVNPSYLFFCSRQVVDAVGLSEKLLGFLAFFPQFPLSLCLHKRYAVGSVLIPFYYEDWFSSAGGQKICRFVDLHLFISEDRYVAIIGRLFNAH